MPIANYNPNYSSSRALLVGIDRYYHPGLSPLGSAEADASSLATILSTRPYDFEVKLLIGPEATRASILDCLSQLRKGQPDDRLLFYFAGHGHTIRDNLGNETGYIIAYDSTPEQDYTAIPLEDIVRLRLHAPAKHVGFILDACFSGAVLGFTRIPNVASTKFLTRKAYQVIAAGAADQPVSDYRSMTRNIVQVLSAQPPLIEGALTFSSLGLYLRQTISADSSRTQIPQFGHLTGSQGGDILLYAQPYEEPPRPRPGPTASATRRRPSSFPAAGMRTAQVDLAGRLDDENGPTVLSVSAGLSHSVWMSPQEKGLLARWLRNRYPKWGHTRRNVYAYTLLLVVLLRPHISKLDEVIIDLEYQGYDSLIKNMLLSRLRDKAKTISKTTLRFSRIPRPSHASTSASLVHKGLSEPDVIVTAQELIAEETKRDRGR